ncbi:MAG: cytochrome c biogenesis protein [Armatimonadota bacterium]|nr:cytochrome c biogenesis protein [Armatimonadota bacterium]
MIKFGKIALLLLLSATTAAGFLWLPPADLFRNGDLARIVVFHVPCSIVASLATAVGTWYAVRYLWKRDLRDDIKSSVSFGLALLFWTLTTVTGAIFARVEWGQYWSWDVKQTSILMLLLIYCAYFALRAAIDDPRKRAAVSAVFTLFALLAVPYLTLILPNNTPNTLHPKNTSFSPAYRIVLWADAVGVCLVYFWAFRLHVALEEIRLHLRQRTRRALPSATVQRVLRQENSI